GDAHALAEPYPRQMVRLTGVGEPLHRWPPARRRQRDPGVVERGPATDQQQPALRIGGGELPAAVGVQVEVIPVDPPPPRLGVMYRRGQACRPGSLGERVLVGHVLQPPTPCGSCPVTPVCRSGGPVDGSPAVRGLPAVCWRSAGGPGLTPESAPPAGQS